MDVRAPGPARGLFRTEVLEAQDRRLEGDVILVHPLAAKLLVPLLLSMAVAAAGFVGSARYARTERVSGYLSPTRGVSTLLPPRAGTVSELRVRTGDTVAVGDVLLTVAVASTLADGGELDSAIRGELSGQQRELERSRRAQDALFEQAQRQRRQRSAVLDDQIRQLDALEALASKRLEIAAIREEKFGTLLAQGVASEDEFQRQRDVWLSLQKELQELGARRLERVDERNRVRGELDAAPLELEQQQASLRMQVSELQTRFREAEGRSSYAIVAPVAGRVALLQAEIGSAVAPGVPVAVLMPEDALLEAKLLVPTRAAGMLEPGQRVGLKYAAFPYQQFGIQSGRIARIDQAVLSPSELRTPLPVAEPVYQATVALDRQDVLAFGRSYPLQTGTLLEADVVLDQRSLLEWILQPLYSLRGAPRIASAS